MIIILMISTSASVTAQSPAITFSTPTATGELTVNARYNVTGISVQALIQYHDSSLWKR